MGINTRRVEALSYASAAALAGIAGFLVVPLTLAEPQLGTVLGLKAFAIAIIAGLSAPRGSWSAVCSTARSKGWCPAISIPASATFSASR